MSRLPSKEENGAEFRSSPVYQIMGPHLGRRSFLAALGASAMSMPSTGRVEAPILLHGGTIYTGQELGTVEALLIRNGRVEFAGHLSDVPASGARRIDLDGATAFPGFVDCHAHLLAMGLQALQLDLSGASSLSALREALRIYASEHPAGPIVGTGWLETHWPERRMPNAADLEAAVPGRVVWLERADGHSGVASSAALALGNIGPATPDPEGGRIERGEDGKPSGLLIDKAVKLVAAKLPEPGPETVRLAVTKAVALCAKRGWTGVADMGMTGDVRAILHDLAANGRLPIRVDCYMRDAHADELLANGPSVDTTGPVRTPGIKLFMDGALGSRGALLLKPYSDLPGTSGIEATPIEHMRARMVQARKAGVQVATHAIGDRANRMVLDLYEDVWRDNREGLRRARWRIEHAQVLSPADIPRFGELGVIASMQPSHAIGDLRFAPDRLGPERLGGAYAWRSLINSGAILCGGSDAPYDNGDPRVQYYSSVYRHDLEGKSGAGWHLEEALDRQTALALFTRSAAFAARNEDQLGSLVVGMRADISVFDRDLTRVDPSSILRAKPVMTFVDGVTSKVA